MHECSFALILVELKKRTGLMLVNMNKARRMRNSQFSCPIHLVSHRTTTPALTPEEIDSPRLIYLFDDALLSIHRTKDITKFILHTKKHILLVKINYEIMEMSIIHKI